MDGRHGREDTALRATGWALGAVVIGEVVAAVLLSRGLAGRPGVLGDPLPRGDLVVDVVVVAAGVLLTTARPRNLIGWTLLGFAFLGASQNVASVYGVRAVAVPDEQLPLGSLALSLGASLWVLGLFLLVPVLLLLYPSGRLPAAWWRWVVAAGAAGATLVAVWLGAEPSAAEDFVAGGTPVAQLPDEVAAVFATVGGVLALGAALLGVGGTVLRTARARGHERAQLLWLLLAALAVLVLALVSPPAWLLTAGLALVPLAVAVGVVGHGLLGIEVVLRGTLLYGLLTGLVLALYVGTTAALSAVVPTGAIPAVVAAALVAVLLAPARARLQRWVDRLVHGEPPDPLAAVRRVGAEVSATETDPLPAVVRAVAEAVQARYVAVVATDGVVLSETGEDGRPRLVQPLSVGGEHLADLVVVPAVRGRGAAPDPRVLETVAAPIAVVVHARRLDREVAAARSRALTATLDERARLRRDLHDGLGPSLSGMVLGLDAVSARLVSDPGSAAEVTGRLRVEAEQAVEEVRRIIDALRPSALDGRGLVPALRERAAAVDLRRGVTVEVVAPDPMPSLPGPVEEAAFRIAEEAVTNVVRHAAATRCLVRVTVGADLLVAVCDDGRGVPDVQSGDGVGLTSMRQRAEALGGSLEVQSNGSGTAVCARLPLASS